MYMLRKVNYLNKVSIPHLKCLFSGVWSLDISIVMISVHLVQYPTQVQYQQGIRHHNRAAWYRHVFVFTFHIRVYGKSFWYQYHLILPRCP